MRILERLKKIFSCNGNTCKIQSSCLSKCNCCRGNIEIDVNNDGKTDIELRKKDSELEVIIHKENKGKV